MGGCWKRQRFWRTATGGSRYMEKRHRRAANNGKKDIRAVPLNSIATEPRGSLLVIGGNENKSGHRPILEEVAKKVGGGKLIIATLASEEPGEQWEEYKNTFKDLGVKAIEQLDIRSRNELIEEPRAEAV